MLRVTEAFGGIGAQRRALQALGIPFEVVEYIDFDKYAVTSYNAIYGEDFKPVDITQLERLKPTDLLTYSFPCQDISVAGLGKGIVRGSTRSGLLYEIERLLLQAQKDGWLPKVLLLENVKNLVGKKYKPQFDEWIEFLETLGYTTQWFILNSKDFGIPQDRSRVFAVSMLRSTEFDCEPQSIPLKHTLFDYIETDVDEKYFINQELADKFFERLRERKISQTIRVGGRNSSDNKHCWDLVCEGKQCQNKSEH